MMEYSYSTEGGLLERSSMEENLLWEPDLVLFDGSVDVSTLEQDTAPVNFGGLSNICDLEHGLKVDSNDLLTGMDILDSYVNSDFDVSLLHAYEREQYTLISASPTLNGCKTKQPASPANSYDSGVGSPGSDVSLNSDNLKILASFESGHEQLEEPLVSTFAPSFFSFPLHNEEIPVSGVKEISIALESFHSKVVHPTEPTFNFDDTLQLTSEDLTAIIGPQPTTGSNVEESLPSTSIIDTSNFVQTTVTPSVSPITVLESASFDAFPISACATAAQNVSPLFVHESSSIQSSPASEQSATSPAVSPRPTMASSSPRSRCGRKSKITTLKEKKQRKRDQNKHAATRYRERKRQETQELEGEYTILEARNKELKDKVSQIRNEMDYLRELMIEVYTLKGLIS